MIQQEMDHCILWIWKVSQTNGTCTIVIYFVFALKLKWHCMAILIFK